VDPIQEQINAVTLEKNAAVITVKTIVNQPIEQLPRSKQVRMAVFSPGWFQSSTIKPDFNVVDVRDSQQAIYDQYDYVSSDLNPAFMFKAKDLAFNPMTKFFYEDLSLPKKKLTDAEMVEINQQYRIIGRCEKKLKELETALANRPKPVQPVVQTGTPSAEAMNLTLAKPKRTLMEEIVSGQLEPVTQVISGGVVLGLILLWIAYRMRRKPR
jgi:hypothetical protein